MGCCFCCFPPYAKVLTPTGFTKVGELKTSERLIIPQNDEKITASDITLKETQFLTFLHFDPETETEFLCIKCENGSELVISSEHLLFKVIEGGKWKAFRARRMEIEDKLIHVDNEKNVTFPKIVEITRKVIKGMFTPFTMNGTLIVDNFLVSSYANADSHNKAHKGFAPLRFWYRVMLKQRGEKKKATCYQHGIHSYPKALMVIRDFCPKRIQLQFS